MNNTNTTPRKRRVIVRMVLWLVSLLLLGAVVAGTCGAYWLYAWRWGDAGVSDCRDPELQQVLRSMDERLCSQELREESRQAIAAIDGFFNFTIKDGKLIREEVQETAFTRARQQLAADIGIREMHAPLRDLIRRAAEEGRADVCLENGSNLLWMALHYHQPELVPYLLEHGCDPNKVCDPFSHGFPQETALSVALGLSPYPVVKCAPVEERTAMLRLLCSCGAEWSKMPHCYAIVTGTLINEINKADAETLLRTMLELGFRPDLYSEEGEPGLFRTLSAMPHTVEMAQELQRLGCLNTDPNVPMQDYLPLHEAIRGENIALVAWLLEQGANPNTKDERLQTTPISIVLDTMRIMADDGDDADDASAPAPTEDEETKNLTDILELLLRHGATPPPADKIPFDKLPPRAAEMLRRA